MAKLNLERDYRSYTTEATRLEDLRLEIIVLPPSYQKLVAEIVLLRLFSVFENTVISIASKIACEARYLDGSMPNLLKKATSFHQADSLFKSYGRSRAKGTLKWTKGNILKIM